MRISFFDVIVFLDSYNYYGDFSSLRSFEMTGGNVRLDLQEGMFLLHDALLS